MGLYSKDELLAKYKAMLGDEDDDDDDEDAEEKQERKRLEAEHRAKMNP